MTSLLLLASLAAAQEDLHPHLTAIVGEVLVHNAENPEGIAAVEDFPLNPGDKVTTGADSQAEVYVDGEHLVVVREKSALTLVSDQELSLSLGSLIARVQKLLEGKRFHVRTPTALAVVRGTEFAVEVTEDAAETHVGVFDEGKVEVRSDQGTETLLMNQETAVMRGRAPLPAYVLRRHARHRSFLRNKMRARHARLRRTWKRMTPSERRSLREKRLETMKERRKARLERRKEGAPGRRGPSKEQQERMRKNKERMEKAREKARQRRGQQQ